MSDQATIESQTAELLTADTVPFGNDERLATLEKQMRDRHAEEIVDLRRNAECLARLRNAGVTRAAYGMAPLYMDVAASDLPVIRPIVGKLKVVGKGVAQLFEKANAGFDVETKCVAVKLSAALYPGFAITYVRPIKSDDPCQIITETATVTKLVCGINGQPGRGSDEIDF